MRKLKVFAAMLCIVALGLATACSKEEKENASIIGKWRSIYCLVENYDYWKAGTTMKIDTNIYYDDNKIGKSWEFTADGYLKREGEQKLKYAVIGDNLVLRRNDAQENIVGSMKIMEIHEEWIKLFSVSDNRGDDGQGTHKEETLVLSKALVQ